MKVYKSIKDIKKEDTFKSKKKEVINKDGSTGDSDNTKE